MSRLKLGVVFGGMSTEHDVSIVSGTSIIKNLDQNKYDIYPIYIDQNGNWYEYKKEIYKIGNVKVGDKLEKIDPIGNIYTYIKNMDCIFPVLHGLYGEDGTIQGLFELLKVPYVGCKVLASSICMDKVYTKIVFEKANINQTKHIYLKKYNSSYIYVDDRLNQEMVSLDTACERVIEKLNYPLFVKPSNSGSSVGINKAKNKEELKSAILYAVKYDNKIVIEEGVNAREIECAVIGNEEPIASCLGEVLSAEEFYSFNSKYKNDESRTVIPANVSEEISSKIREVAIKAYKAADCSGLARVDFFLEKDTNKIYLNEINTLPGFTDISMYPKLLIESGMSYSKILDELIELAIK